MNYSPLFSFHWYNPTSIQQFWQGVPKQRSSYRSQVRAARRRRNQAKKGGAR